MKYIKHVSNIVFDKAMSQKKYISNKKYNKGDILQFKNGRKAFPWEIEKVEKKGKNYEYILC